MHASLRRIRDEARAVTGMTRTLMRSLPPGGIELSDDDYEHRPEPLDVARFHQKRVDQRRELMRRSMK
jgi:hypothetical protein